MSSATKRGLRAVGAGLGCALAVGYVLAGRLPASDALPGATLEVVAARSGELIVAPTGTLLAARDLRRGGPARRARIVVRNPTEVAVEARPHLVFSTPDLDRSVRLSIAADGRRLFSGPLGDLRAEGHRPLRIRAGQRTELTLAAAIPSSAPSGWEAREVEAKLELLTRVAGR